MIVPDHLSIPNVRPANPGSYFDVSHSFESQPRRQDSTITIGRRSSFERSGRVGGRDGRNFYRFELRNSSRMQITVRNRDFLLVPFVNVRLQKNSGSGKISRTAIPGGIALIDRRLSRGTYTLRISSSSRSVRYRLNYRRRSDDFDFFR